MCMLVSQHVLTITESQFGNTFSKIQLVFLIFFPKIVVALHFFMIRGFPKMHFIFKGHDVRRCWTMNHDSCGCKRNDLNIVIRNMFLKVIFLFVAHAPYHRQHIILVVIYFLSHISSHFWLHSCLASRLLSYLSLASKGGSSCSAIYITSSALWK